MDNNFTKCVTIRQSETSDPPSTNPPPEEWMKCFKVVANQAAQELSLSSSCDWHNKGKSQVLLHIDTEQSQVQILPFLFTLVHCVYLVVFDVKDHARALADIHFAMQNIVAHTFHRVRSKKADEKYPKVYLVRMRADCGDICKFENELETNLQRSYKKLIKRNKGRLCWDVVGADLDIQNTGDLAEDIKQYNSSPEASACDWIGYYCDLRTKAKLMVYSDVKCEMLRTLQEEDIDKCLSFLHNYGFIFYTAFNNLKDSDNVVVLQPQCLSSVINKVHRLCNVMPLASIADFVSDPSARGPIHTCMEEWFQSVCTNMGLAIEAPTYRGNEFLFLCLNRPPEQTPSIVYSVDPLLLALNHDNKHFVPVAFFAKFVSCLLRRLEQLEKQKMTTIQGRSLEIVELRQHAVHISMQGGKSHIHVIEQESCLEIGIQQLSTSPHQDSNPKKHENTVKRLNRLCREVKTVVDASREETVEQRKLHGSSFDYGFYSCCKLGMQRFARYYDIDGQLHLSCVDHLHIQPIRPQQKIWLKDVSIEQVC